MKVDNEALAAKNADTKSLKRSIEKCKSREGVLNTMIKSDPDFAGFYRKDKRGVVRLRKKLEAELKTR